MPAATSFENIYQASESAIGSNSAPGAAYLSECLMYVDAHRLELAGSVNSQAHPLKLRGGSVGAALASAGNEVALAAANANSNPGTGDGAVVTATTTFPACNQQQQQLESIRTHRESSAPANTYRRRQHNHLQQQQSQSASRKRQNHHLQTSCGAFQKLQQKQHYGLDLDSIMCLCDDLVGLKHYGISSAFDDDEEDEQQQVSKNGAGSLRTNRHRYGDCPFSSDYYEDEDDEEEDEDDEEELLQLKPLSQTADHQLHYYDTIRFLRQQQHQHGFNYQHDVEDQIENAYNDSQFLSMTPPTQHCLTIEELRSVRTSCWLCGCNWQQDHVSLDCQECGGYALSRPCPSCDGKCKQVWKRNLTATHDQHKALWVGQCALQQEQRNRSGRTTLTAI